MPLQSKRKERHSVTERTEDNKPHTSLIPKLIASAVCSLLFNMFALQFVPNGQQQHQIVTQPQPKVVVEQLPTAAPHETNSTKEPQTIVPTSQQQQQQHPESKGPKRTRIYPVSNLIEDWPTAAAQEIGRQHDRVIVESMSYFESLTEKDMANWSTMNNLTASDVCINIFTSDRKLRYIDALLMTLFKAQPLERLLSFAQVNLLNIERRPQHMEYPHLKHKLAKIPFLNVYNFSDLHPYDSESEFIDTLRQDTIASLDICIESNLPFCLMMEDDGIVTKAFIDHLETNVIRPMQRGELEASSVSLYSYRSHPWTKTTRITDPWYVDSGTYENDLSNVRPGQFSVPEIEVNFGAVADIYPLDMVKKLRPFLAEQEKGVFAADILMAQHFTKSVGRNRHQMVPSLVNHIGFYSERQTGVSYTMSDVQFVLDPTSEHE